MLPFIAIGATSGAAFGSWLAGQLVDAGLIPTEALLIVAIAPLLLSIVLMRMASKRETSNVQAALDSNKKEQTETTSAAVQPSIWSGAKMVMFSKFLLLRHWLLC